ncbi:hypothetical protein ACO0LM_13990 [Undibacterium sp. Di26W]|uniref:hypothetical protein n=1 Tax=Undibacterium sp. Di26W TaxID=3413035 RepID=UPI003BF16430
MRFLKITLFSVNLIFVVSVNAESTIRSAEIDKIYQEDQKTRSLFKRGDVYDRAAELKSDAAHRMRLFEMMVDDLPWSAKDFALVSRIFQHTNTGSEAEENESWRSQENHLLGFFFSRKSARLGLLDDTGSMVDRVSRYLKASGIPGEYGLELVSRTPLKVCPINPKITDEQRLDAGLPLRLNEIMSEFCH